MFDQTLDQAYRQTLYRVFDPVQPFDLQVDVYSAELLACYRKTHTQQAALMTAWNPYSQLRSLEQNTKSQQSLIKQVQQYNYLHLPALGMPCYGDWPAEESLLILGITQASAKQLAQDYEQNAILWIECHAIPRLLWL